ncbi:HAD family hydrolase [Tolypothrix campylonemoides VB511288]|nr:HAD family hydrolase [Tolypothrix campylonemoides VB511288]
MRFIDKFDAILLDMGNTFMFDCDRFSDLEDFGKTYREINGTVFNNAQVQSIISEVLNQMGKDYENPKYYECFPPVKNYIVKVIQENKLPDNEIDLLQEVFAIHEIGIIPDSYVEAIVQLRKTHKLGVVSNIWCKSEFCLKEFHRVGITDLFKTIIFSSDYGIIKPSPLIFQKAIEQMEVSESKIVFVGDNLLFDITGAKKVGLSAIWINSDNKKLSSNIPTPDLVIQNLRDLLE